MKYFLWALTILFIALKLTNYIDWSWFIVLLPFLIYLSLNLLWLLIIAFVWIMAARETRNNK